MGPDEELAELVMERLVEHGLIEPSRRAEVSARIAAGSATADDWRLWIELGPAGRTQGTEDAQD